MCFTQKDTHTHNTQRPVYNGCSQAPSKNAGQRRKHLYRGNRFQLEDGDQLFILETWDVTLQALRFKKSPFFSDRFLEAFPKFQFAEKLYLGVVPVLQPNVFNNKNTNKTNSNITSLPCQMWFIVPYIWLIRILWFREAPTAMSHRTVLPDRTEVGERRQIGSDR